MERTVRKEMRFEAAHRLVQGYPGKCRWVHGHSWVVFVTLTLRDDASLDQFGFVEDFSLFKELRNWIDQNLDHASLVSREDMSWRAWLEEERQKLYVFDGNPTSELIANFLFIKAQEIFNSNRVYVSKVEVMETCTSHAAVIFN